MFSSARKKKLFHGLPTNNYFIFDQLGLKKIRASIPPTFHLPLPNPSLTFCEKEKKCYTMDLPTNIYIYIYTHLQSKGIVSAKNIFEPICF